MKKDKEIFNKAQARANKEYEVLIKSGFRSEGLYRLCSANFNRFDRDNVNEISMRDILEITKIEE